MPNTKTITKTQEKTFVFSPCKQICFISYWPFDKLCEALSAARVNGYSGLHDIVEEAKKIHSHVILQFEKKVSRKQVMEMFPEGLIANGVIEPVHNWQACLRYLIHKDNKDKVQYSADRVRTFGTAEPYKEALLKSSVEKNVPFDVFQFLALHSRITNWAEYATVLETRFPQLVSAFGKLQSGQIQNLNRILESKNSVDLAFVRSEQYEVFDSAADLAEQGRVAAFSASLGLYE